MQVQETQPGKNQSEDTVFFPGTTYMPQNIHLLVHVLLSNRKITINIICCIELFYLFIKFK